MRNVQFRIETTLRMRYLITKLLCNLYTSSNLASFLPGKGHPVIQNFAATSHNILYRNPDMSVQWSSDFLPGASWPSRLPLLMASSPKPPRMPKRMPKRRPQEPRHVSRCGHPDELCILVSWRTFQNGANRESRCKNQSFQIWKSLESVNHYCVVCLDQLKVLDAKEVISFSNWWFGSPNTWQISSVRCLVKTLCKLFDEPGLTRHQGWDRVRQLKKTSKMVFCLEFCSDLLGATT